MFNSVWIDLISIVTLQCQNITLDCCIDQNPAGYSKFSSSAIGKTVSRLYVLEIPPLLETHNTVTLPVHMAIDSGRPKCLISY